MRRIVKTLSPRQITVKCALPNVNFKYNMSQFAAKNATYKNNAFLPLKDEYKPKLIRRFSNEAKEIKEDNNKTEMQINKPILKSNESSNKSSNELSNDSTNKKQMVTITDAGDAVISYLFAGVAICGVSCIVYDEPFNTAFMYVVIWPVLIPYFILLSCVIMIDKMHALIHDKNNNKKIKSKDK